MSEEINNARESAGGPVNAAPVGASDGAEAGGQADLRGDAATLTAESETGQGSGAASAVPDSQLASTAGGEAQEAEPYDWDRCTISLSVTLLPRDADPRGRATLIGARTHEDAPIIACVRSPDIPALSGPLVELLDQLKGQLPARRAAAEERRRQAEEQRRAAAEKVAAGKKAAGKKALNAKARTPATNTRAAQVTPAQPTAGWQLDAPAAAPTPETTPDKVPACAAAPVLERSAAETTAIKQPSLF
jgi:hypothetical protein